MTISPGKSRQTSHFSSSADGPVNIVLWIAFGSILLLVGMFSIFAVHGRFTLDMFLGLLTHALRTGLYVSMGLFIEAMLLRTVSGYLTASPQRRIPIHLFWILVMFLALTLLADFFIYAFAGYHVTTAVRILFSDGIKGIGKVMEAAGISWLKIVFAIVALSVFLAISVVLSKLTRNVSRHWNISIRRGSAIKLIFISLGLIAFVEVLNYNARDPVLWELEVRCVPLAFTLAKPETEMASFRVRLKKPPPMRVDEAALDHVKGSVKPDIYIVLIESLRKSILTPEVMPHFARFARQSWTFEHPITTGNVTHYSWYGLLCANYPIFFDIAKHDPQVQGSLPLKILKRLGYRIELWATPDTAYQNLEAVVFNHNGELLDQKFHPLDKLPEARDQKVMNELIRRMKIESAGGVFHLIALDSTHFEYAWGPDFTPPFQPFAKGTSVIKDYMADEDARRLLENRYKNSAAWVDSLLGYFFATLEATGRMQNSMIIVTGDHGEAFWEHGVGSHGSNLGREQLEVAFAMQFPSEQPRHFDTVFSLMDVMPSILYGLGYDPGADRLFAGMPLQKRINAGNVSAAVAKGHGISFQGWNERAFKFILTYDDKRVFLELDKADPMESQRLLVKQVTWNMGVDDEGPGNEGDSGVYRQFLGDLPRIMGLLPFLDFE